jgi:hypothetical protein
MENEEFFLLDSEYFQLEVHEWKKKELDLERQLVNMQREITKRDIAIMNLNIDNQRRKLKELEDRATEYSLKIENVEVMKGKVTDNISTRLGLVDIKDWGYNPETLEIIF